MEQFLSDSDDLWRDRPITRPMKGEIKLTQVEIKRLVFFYVKLCESSKRPSLTPVLSKVCLGFMNLRKLYDN
jgi:hypothetical protein